jgi:glycosyltransferase involved in cell wall biosynthesis
LQQESYGSLVSANFASVFQVTNTFIPNFIGGRETHVYYLAKGLSQRGYRVTVLTGDNVQTTQVESNDCFKTIRLPIYSLPMGSNLEYRISPSMIPVLRRNRPDIIHVHDHLHFSLVAGALSKLNRKQKLILTVHSVPNFFGRFIENVSRFPFRIASQMLLERTDAIITVSNYALNELKNMLSVNRRLKLFLIYSSFDQAETDYLLLHSKSIQERLLLIDKDTIFSCGRLEKRKGFDVLLLAFEKVAKQLPRLVLIIAGPDAGEKRNLIAMTESLGLQDRVHICGALSDGELISSIAASSAFVLPSRQDNYPVILLKAMYLGKPVIATSVGAIPEMLNAGREGLIVRPDEHLELASAIETMISNRVMAREMAAQASLRAREKFGYSKMISQTSAVYESIM